MTGLVLGKFLPPHMGHKFLIDFATQHSWQCHDQEVTVFVAGLQSEPIPVFERYYALKKHYKANPRVRVTWANKEMPQYPHEHPDFWSMWKEYIETFCYKIDRVYASDEYGAKLAEVLGAVFIPCDPLREMTGGLSATRIRNNMIDEWDNMLPEIRPFLTKRVVVFGAESCGKTTVCQSLASYFDTTWTPEWARGYLDTVGVDVTKEKIHTIMMAQPSFETAAVMSPKSRVAVFHDTDLLATHLWSDILLGQDPEIHSFIRNTLRSSKPDLYLVMDTNIPFVPDPQRYGDGVRQATTGDCIRLIKEHWGDEVPYKVIKRNTKRERFVECLTALREHNIVYYPKDY